MPIRFSAVAASRSVSTAVARELLADRGFRRFAAARTASLLGTGFGRVAIAFAVLGLPGSTPVHLAAVIASQAVPTVLLILFSGVIADRYPRQRLLVLAELLSALAWAGLAALTFANRGPLLALMALAFLSGVGIALFGPASTAILPDLVPSELLQTANGLLRLGQNTALVLGLALGGAAVALIGAGSALAVDAVSFLVSALLLAGLRLSTMARAADSPSMLQDLRLGWHDFISRQWLWVVVVQFSLVVAALSAYIGVLGPLATVEHLGGAKAWGLLAAADALGTVAGATLSLRIRPHRPILVAVLATFVLGVPALLIAWVPLWATMIAMFASGVATDVFSVLWSTTMQREVPGPMLARVSAYDYLGSFALAPIGIALAGPAAVTFGTSTALTACGALVVIATLGALLAPQVRRLTAPKTLAPVNRAPG